MSAATVWSVALWGSEQRDGQWCGELGGVTGKPAGLLCVFGIAMQSANISNLNVIGPAFQFLPGRLRVLFTFLGSPLNSLSVVVAPLQVLERYLSLTADAVSFILWSGGAACSTVFKRSLKLHPSSAGERAVISGVCRGRKGESQHRSHLPAVTLWETDFQAL